MRYVLCQLPFQPDLLLFLRDVIDGNLEAQVLEQDAFDDEHASVLVDPDGHALFFLVRPFGRLVDEVRDFLKFADGENLFRGLQVGVGYEIAVLRKQVVHQYLFLVLVEDPQAFA